VKLEGKTAVITGAASGIGKSIAAGLMEAGARIVIADIDETALAETSEEFKKSGRQTISVKCDVSNSKDADQLINSTLEEFGRIDILFNNAGVSGAATPLVELSDEDWNHTLSVNLSGMFYCSRAAARQMIKQQDGKIINVTSVAALKPTPSSGDYCASKAGAHLLTQALAIELIRHNIKVNEICPGMFDTNLAPKLKAAVMADIKKFIPIGRLAQTDEIKGLAVFLSSAESDYLVGTAIPIDGGINIR
jgi:NAD(P)-dependent dehydrogenase (short-subunit alcohol dehydrogenase family)